ncbi:hypothetical protein CHARACLAT_021291 [Characodon lateralis]|uniref:Uncharacterized protein n=1 Tax=Characodon lateralis TaxID=208331 RepID=A0ABU7EFS0_9TELE|nr:hypothetical protein [Characodon lateralis]
MVSTDSPASHFPQTLTEQINRRLYPAATVPAQEEEPGNCFPESALFQPTGCWSATVVPWSNRRHYGSAECVADPFKP